MTDDTTEGAAALRALREKAGYSVRGIAKELGMSASSYKHYEDRYKRRFFDPEFAGRVARAVEKKGLSRSEAAVLVGDLDQAARPAGTVLVPVLDVEASAGPGLIAPDHEVAAYRLQLPADYLASLTESHPSKLQIISVKGTSMLPTLKPGDLVMVDTAKTSLAFDGIFVLDIDDAVLVKRIGRSAQKGCVAIISDNREQPAVDVPRDEVRVVGKVVWKGVRE